MIIVVGVYNMLLYILQKDKIAPKVAINLLDRIMKTFKLGKYFMVA